MNSRPYQILSTSPPHHQANALSLGNLENCGGNPVSTREIDLIRKDRSLLRVQVFRRLLVWKGENAIQRTYIDISERKNAEEALIDGERQYRDLIEENPLGIQIVDGQGHGFLVNKALVDMLGYGSAEEIRRLPMRGFLDPSDPAKALSLEDLDRQGSDTPSTLEVNLVRKDGSVLPVQIFRRVLLWEGQKAIQRTYIDISERKRVEAALLDSEQRYRDLFEGSSFGLRISNGQGNRVANQAMATLLGYDSVEDILTSPRRQVIAPYDRQRAITLEMIEAEGDNLPKSIEMDLLRKDGSILPVEIFWRLLEWEGVKAVERTYIDISERREHERALQEHHRTVQALRGALARASQIGTMGEISSVIAHELHQPLTAIANTASAAQRRLADVTVEKSTVLDEMLPLIAQQAERAGRVIGGIRKLFEGGILERSIEDIDSIVDEACDLAVTESIGENIAIKRQV